MLSFSVPGCAQQITYGPHCALFGTPPEEENGMVPWKKKEGGTETNHIMYDFDASTPDSDEFAKYVSDMSGNSVTVCNKTYTCRRLAEGDFWSSDPKHDSEPASRECQLDILAAAGYANSCDVQKTIRSTPEACTSKRPILANGDDLVQLRGSENSNEMPSLLEGGWKCLISPNVTATTHRPRHMERVGGLTFVHMEEKPPPPAVAKELPKPEPTPEATPAAKNEAVPPSPPPPPASDPSGARDSFLRADASPNSTPTPTPAMESTWTRCPLPRPGAQAVACSVDRDCPLSTDQYKEILWSQVRDSAQTNFPALLRHIQDNVSSDITWTDSPLTRERLTTKTQMKNALMKMFDTDPTFRASVTGAVDGDAEFAERRNAVVGGSCGVQGRCKVAAVTPQTRLFDGKNDDVVFTVLDDETVTFTTPGGLSREVQAIKCAPSTQELCDRATEADGTTLRAGVTPLSSTYRIRAPDTMSEFVVMNHISARDIDRCSARVCELNQGSCPGSSCMLDEEKRCVPRTGV